MSKQKRFFRPTAMRAYLEIYGNHQPPYNNPVIGDIIRAIKRARPGEVKDARFTILGYPLNPMNHNLSNNLMTIEGFYQGVATDLFLNGRNSNGHGVPIPIKRVIIPKVTGGSYRVFASTFALLHKWDDPEYIYVPFRGGYARAEIDGREIVIVDDNPIPLNEFTVTGAVITNKMYQTVYDFHRLGLKTPKKLAGFVVDPSRGYLKNILKRVQVLVADLYYIFATPAFRDLGNYRDKVDNLLKLGGSESILQFVGGHGYQGYGVMVSKPIVNKVPLPVNPESILFARYGERYVNLRPIPVNTVEKKHVESMSERYLSLRLNPPYYVPAYNAKHLVIQYLPGTIFRDIPNMDWEVM